MTVQDIQPFIAIPKVTMPENFELDNGTFLVKMYEEHGPIFRGEHWGREVVFMVGPEANRFIMTSNRQHFSHGLGWGQMMSVLELFGNGLLTMDGPEHAHHRRLMNPAFTVSYMDRYLPVIHQVVQRRVAEWTEQGEVDIFDEMRKITFDIAAGALMGLEQGNEVDRFRDIYYTLLNLGAILEEGEDGGPHIAKLHAELNSMLIPQIEARRRNPTDDVLGLLVQARDSNGEPLSEQQLIAHANILLVAGHETSTSLGSWLLTQLLQYPDYLQRVLEEQTAILGDQSEPPTLEQIKQMKVLHNALSETERLFPPVPHGPRGVVEDFSFAGYHVPAGSNVYYAIAASHRIPSIFKDPERFDPDRFAEPRNEDRKQPYSLVGFGGGPRICIGINLAQIEIKAFASHVLRNYQVELLPGQDLRQVYGATGMPLNGIRMRIRAR